MKIKNKPAEPLNNNHNPMFIKISILVICSLLIGGILGNLTYPIFFSLKNAENLNEISQKGQRQGGNFKFINPLLECESSSTIKSKNIYAMENKAKGTIGRLVDNKNISSISIYFRDLNNGPWFGINEDVNYKPASLLKVPVFIAYLKKIDNNMNLLTSTLKYSENEIKMPEPAEGLDSLNPETEYKLDKLFERMIVNSDNQAYTLLVNRIDTKDLDSVMQDLGMTVPNTESSENILTAKSYASLFRVLYNSSYLSRNASEYALNLMNYARYDRGLTKNLPEELSVSHKFGLRKDVEPSKDIYLHDCGIVYYPERPYLICIMTKGTDYEKLAESISTLSKDIYDEIKAQ